MFFAGKEENVSGRKVFWAAEFSSYMFYAKVFLDLWGEKQSAICLNENFPS